MLDGYLMLALAFVWPALGVATVGTGAYLARRYVRAVERRGVDESALAEMRARVAELEAVVEGTRQDVDRLEAGQAFTERLLTERVSKAR